MSDIIKVKVSYPSKNEQNLQEFLLPNINYSLTSRSVLSLISHPESRPSVRPSGHSFSKALILHLLASDSSG